MPDPEKQKLSFGDPGCPEYGDGRPFVLAEEQNQKNEDKKENTKTTREKWWPE